MNYNMTIQSGVVGNKTLSHVCVAGTFIVSLLSIIITLAYVVVRGQLAKVTSLSSTWVLGLAFQVLKLGGKYLFLLSQLPGPNFFCFSF